MAESLAKKLAGGMKLSGGKSKKSKTEEWQKCLWCPSKVRITAELPVCKTCESIGREEVTDAASATLKQLFAMAGVVKQFIQLAKEGTDAEDYHQQLASLSRHARIVLHANYPITLTAEAADTVAFQDNLTEAFKLWMRETAQKDKTKNGILCALISSFDPSGMTTSLVDVHKYPEGSITISLATIASVLGVASDLKSEEDRVNIELPNLFALLDPNYSGSLACTLEGDPDADS